MRDLIINSTLEGWPRVISPRFFASERGYAAALSCHIIRGVEDRDLMTGGRIVEANRSGQDSFFEARRGDSPIFIGSGLLEGEAVSQPHMISAMKMREARNTGFIK